MSLPPRYKEVKSGSCIAADDVASPAPIASIPTGAWNRTDSGPCQPAIPVSLHSALALPSSALFALRAAWAGGPRK